MLSWIADADTIALMNTVKEKNHPHLAEAQIALGFNDSKPFTKNRFNWGKTSKFSKIAQLWHGNKYDFSVLLCSDAWLDVLNGVQREALLDLHLTRCKPCFQPATITINGKEKPVKDEFGRIDYTEEFLYDEDGIIKWNVLPLDLSVFAENVRRYGLWTEDLLEFKAALDIHNKAI